MMSCFSFHEVQKSKRDISMVIFCMMFVGLAGCPDHSSISCQLIELSDSQFFSDWKCGVDNRDLDGKSFLTVRLDCRQCFFLQWGG